MFQQNFVLSTNGFDDINTKPFAWARAFPTLSIPTCIKILDHWEWRIFHDPTGWGTPRDKTVKMKLWYEYMMWHSDGQPAAHPMFALVLYNHNIKNQLQPQIHYLLNTSVIDPNLAILEICTAQNDDIIKIQTKKLLEKAVIYSGNSIDSCVLEEYIFGVSGNKLLLVIH